MKLKNKREIKDKIYELTLQSVRLRTIAKSDKINFEKTINLNKKQDAIYKKCIFLKNILKELEKEQEHEKNKIN